MADKTVTIKPSGGDYTSLQAAITGELVANADLTSGGLNGILTMSIEGDWTSTTDTSAATENGFTQDATHYLDIVPDSANVLLKSGWDATRYRLEVTDADCLTIYDNYTRVTGMQINALFSAGGSKYGIFIDALAASNDIRIKNCRIDASNAGTNRGIGIGDADANVTIENCIITTDSRGIYVADGASVDIANCVIYGDDVRIGIEFDAGTGTITNCAVFHTGDDFDIAGGASVAIDHNASDDNDVGTNGFTPSGSDWLNEYADPANGDFTLLNGGNCYLGGTPVSGLTLDIEGDAYNVTTPSVGVDEYVAAGSSIAIFRRRIEGE